MRTSIRCMALLLGALSLTTASARDNDSSDWEPCARESQECRFRGQAHVRFGANVLLRVMWARDGLGCGTHSFGGDPTLNVRKTCSVYRP